MQKVLSHWLLTALIISLGFGQLLRFEILGIPLYVHDLLVIFLLILEVPNFQIVRNLSIPAGLKLFLLGLGVGYLRALTLYPFSDLLIPGLYALRLLSYLALYLTLEQTGVKPKRAIFILSGAITVILGLAQYFFMPDMRIFYYLGWDDHLNRLVMPHFDPTFTSAMLSLFFLLIFPSRSSLLYLPAIFLSYSRSIWLTLLLTLATSYKKIILPFLIFSIFIILVLPKRFGEGNNLLRTYSITSRLTSDLSYITTYKWDLIIGRGFNTLILDAPSSRFPNHATSPNNSYLYLLLTTGVVGLVGWGIFLKELYRESIHKPIIIFIMLGSLFNNLMFYPFMLLLLLLSHSENRRIVAN